ncbi:hypothetical protein N7462_011142 [Penicillium macrosclerotiorum]|uniref:uncharacterized protein n=1 Tax=Penicillium macrosclerotiorum TaxID=303699 RepID=UPI002546CBA1|nr:uncharacterized protein N7462_011142 [Penicillium macrosclerotiorum]KAJ5666733.1 hypothetical protein N7462_011142 [Penicillium macrosclerotiorum]
MSRRRTSHSEPMNEALAYPFSSQKVQMPPAAAAAAPAAAPALGGGAPPRRGPIEGPNGRRLIRRVTWRSSTYKLMASLWVLGVLYILWLIRDLFYLPFTPSESSPPGRGDE